MYAEMAFNIQTRHSRPVHRHDGGEHVMAYQRRLGLRRFRKPEPKSGRRCATTSKCWQPATTSSPDRASRTGRLRSRCGRINRNNGSPERGEPHFAYIVQDQVCQVACSAQAEQFKSIATVGPACHTGFPSSARPTEVEIVNLARFDDAAVKDSDTIRKTFHVSDFEVSSSARTSHDHDCLAGTSVPLVDTRRNCEPGQRIMSE